MCALYIETMARKTTICVYIDDEMREALEQASKIRRTSKSEIMREAIEIDLKKDVWKKKKSGSN